MSFKKKIIHVSSIALVDIKGNILISLRPKDKIMPDLWEFPGGKIEKNETPEEALNRELEEELGITISFNCLSPVGFSSHEYEDFHLILLLFIARKWKGVPKPLEGNLIKWVKPKELYSLKMPEANKPLKHVLFELL